MFEDFCSHEKGHAPQLQRMYYASCDHTARPVDAGDGVKLQKAVEGREIDNLAI